MDVMGMDTVVFITGRATTAIETFTAIREHTDKETFADREIIGKSQNKISNCN